MPVYPCPECGAQLRPAKAVPAGKKLRCPKCDTVFAVGGASAPAERAKPAKPAAGGDDDVGQYGLAADQDERTSEERMSAAFDPIKDRFKRSARGPALVIVVKPSTWLLATGVLICGFALAGAFWSVFPMIFKVEKVQPEDKNAKFRPPSQEGRQFEELTDEERRNRFLFLGGFVFQFLWGAAVCNGASKMHTLDGYGWAMLGSIMAIIGPGVPLGIYLIQLFLDPKESDATYLLPAILCFTVPGIPVSALCIATLRNPKVIAGFEEEKPEEF